MLIYTAKTFRATRTGQQLKTVRCEKCATEYHYQLSRTASGSAAAPYRIGQESAQRRADSQAKSRLARRLQWEAEMVPCPKCHWVNRALIVRYRKGKYKGWAVAAIVVLVLGGLIDFIVYLNYESIFNRQVPDRPPEIIGIAALTFFLAGLLLFLRWCLRRQIKPHYLPDEAPRVPVGTPPALLKQRDPLSGAGALVAVPSDWSNLQADAQWATFRAGQLAFEPVCCQCLEPATTAFKQPFAIDNKTLGVPLCDSCLEKLRRQWWLRNLVSLPFALLMGWLLTMLVPGGVDGLGRLLLALFGGGFLALIGVVIHDRMLRPYRLRTADRARNIYKIHFQNSAYTALLIRKFGQQDGLFQSGQGVGGDQS